MAMRPETGLQGNNGKKRAGRSAAAAKQRDGHDGEGRRAREGAAEKEREEERDAQAAGRDRTRATERNENRKENLGRRKPRRETRRRPDVRAKIPRRDAHDSRRLLTHPGSRSKQARDRLRKEMEKVIASAQESLFRNPRFLS